MSAAMRRGKRNNPGRFRSARKMRWAAASGSMRAEPDFKFTDGRVKAGTIGDVGGCGFDAATGGANFAGQFVEAVPTPRDRPDPRTLRRQRFRQRPSDPAGCTRNHSRRSRESQRHFASRQDRTRRARIPDLVEFIPRLRRSHRLE